MRYGFLCVGAVATALALAGGPAGAYAQAPTPAPTGPAGVTAPSPTAPATVHPVSPSPPGVERFVARMTGSEEVPPNKSAGMGVARVTVNVAQNQVCWEMAVSKLEAKVTAAHIHKGAAGQNGPPVVAISPAPTAVSRGCKSVQRTLADGIAMHPQDYYVNVHTSKYPDGEVRGQLSPA